MITLNIIIRKEELKDYQKVAEVSLLAFRNRKPGEDFYRELILGDVLRHSSYYDNDLALVAEIEGQIVGYALFSPVHVSYIGKMVKSVILAPIAVHPEYQGLGIGGKLLDEGHKIAKEKGYAASLLFGEKDYYPRFGYIPKMFSYTGLKIKREDLPITNENVTQRPVEPRDIDSLVSIWNKWYEDEPIAVFPGNNLLDWVSHDREFRATTVLKGEEVIGYVRYEVDRPWVIMEFIAKDKCAMHILTCIKGLVAAKQEAEVVHIALNPYSKKVAQEIPLNLIPNINMSVHGMLKVLDEDSTPIKDYVTFISVNENNAAVINFPPAIEWC